MNRVILGLALCCTVTGHAREGESRVISVAAPVYPDIARAARLEATVEVAVELGGHGTLVARVLKTPNTMFDESALAAARKWRLDLPQGEEVILTFRYTMLPACSVPSAIQIYRPPFSVEVFAAARHPVTSDGEQLSCAPVTIQDNPNQ